MKCNSTILCALLLIIGAVVGFSQIPQSDCMPPLPPNPTPDLVGRHRHSPDNPRGNGWNITSHRYLKIVVVFVDFADDTYAPNSPEWPIGQAPIWVNNGSLFTPTGQYSEVAFNPEPRSVSDYFWQMSQKSFDDGLRIYGDCFHVQFPKTRQQVVDQNISIDDASSTVIGILDNQIDFATYDRWTSRELFQHSYAPDGVVDLFVIVWRNLVLDLEPGTDLRNGLVSRGFGVKSAVGLAVNPVPGNEMPILLPVDNGARSIYTNWGPYAANGFWQPYGASIRMLNWMSDGDGALTNTRSTGIYDGVFRELIHEIGHHLHGSHRQSGTWSVLSVSDSRSYAMSAAELIDLGWIEPVIIRKTGTVPENIQLGDLYTTGDVLAIEVESLTNPLNVDKSTQEGLYNSSEGSKWYYVENHQMISPYDFTIGRLPIWGPNESTARGASRGLYITYNEDQIGFARQHVQSASGEFRWNNDRNANFWGRSNFPVFERLEQTRSEGATHSEQIPLSTPRDFGGEFPHAVFPVYLMWQGGTAVEKQLYLGESLNDHHDVCHAPVWTPWSSPSSSYTRSGLLTNPIQSGISVVIESETSGVFNLKVANNFAPIGPPSAPIGLNYPSSVGICGTAASPINYTAAISWVANVEPDLAGYRIYRAPGVNTLGWELIETLPSSAVSFEDSEIDNPFPPIPAWNYLARVWYRVVAIDNTDLESSDCEHISINLSYLAGQPGQQEVLTLLPINEVMIREFGGKVWPNPTSTWVNFEPKLEADSHGEAEVSVVSLSGELITKDSFYWQSSRKVISVPVDALPRGVYVLRLRLGTATFNSRFIRE